MTAEPSTTDAIELGRRAEAAYDRAERTLGPAAARGGTQLASVDAGIGRDVWRRFCELRGETVDFPPEAAMSALGLVATLAIDQVSAAVAEGSADAYAAVGARLWKAAAMACRDV